MEIYEENYAQIITIYHH